MMVCGATGSPRAWSPRQALPSCRHPGGLTRTPAVACGELAAGQPLCRALSQHALPVSDPVSDPAPGRLLPSSSSGDLVCLRLTRWCSDSQEQNPKWCLGRHCAPSSTPSAWRGAGVPWAGMRPAGASPRPSCPFPHGQTLRHPVCPRDPAAPNRPWTARSPPNPHGCHVALRHPSDLVSHAGTFVTPACRALGCWGGPPVLTAWLPAGTACPTVKPTTTPSSASAVTAVRSSSRGTCWR